VSEVLPVITGILALGIVAQVVSKRLRVPSVLFLILIGVVVGPQGFGFVTLETFGAGLSTVVGVSVAIILFDGAAHLKLDYLREAPTAILRLITVGALVMLLGTAAAVRVFLGVGWDVAFLIGALLVATGPTVITPILEVVPVPEHIAAAMEAEGVINDVSAAVLAVVIFEVVVIEGHATGVPTGFIVRLAAGIGIGIVAAAAIWAMLTQIRSAAGDAPQIARLVAIGGAVLAYGLAESVFSETGVAAAAAAGFVVGNADLPHTEEILEFGRDLTLIVLAFVFISLAALIDFGDILGLGLAGVAVVAAVTLLVRPLLVFISARGRRFTRNQRLFLSFVAPRGIIPASVATLFAIELQEAGNDVAAQTLAGTVFLVIFITVLFQGGLARQIADYLEVTPMPTIIVGGGRVGRQLAERLENRGENITIIDEDPDAVEQLRSDNYTVVEGDATVTSVLEEAGLGRARIVVAATGDDDTNLLVSQLARNKFDIETVVARVNSPDNVDAYEALDVRAIDVSSATAWTLDNEIERPELFHWMNELGDGHDVQEIEVTADDLVGKAVGDLDESIPDGCIVAVITHADDGETRVANPDDVVEPGDHVTFLGNSEAVRQAVSRFHPHD